MIGKEQLILILTLTILTSPILFGQDIQAIENYGVTAIDHTPKTLQKNGILSVTVDFSDNTDILYVKLVICQLEPEFLCNDAPIIMEETATNTYSGEFQILYEVGTLVGYHIQLVYTNDSIVFLPDSIDFLGDDNIIEPLTGDFYYNASYVVANTEETSCFGFFFLGISLAFISIVINRKRQIKQR